MVDLKKRTSRVIVSFGKIKLNKKDVDAYIQPLKTTAEYYGFKIEDSIPKVERGQGDKKRVYYLRGDKGGGSIRLKSKEVAKDGTPRYKQIPVPPGANIGQIEAFIKKATKNKPDAFITRDGQSYPIKV